MVCPGPSRVKCSFGLDCSGDAPVGIWLALHLIWKSGFLQSLISKLELFGLSDSDSDLIVKCQA